MRSHNFSTAATLAALTLCLPMLARLGTLASLRHVNVAFVAVGGFVGASRLASALRNQEGHHLRIRHPNVHTRERCHSQGSQGGRRNVPWKYERARDQKDPARGSYL